MARVIRSLIVMLLASAATARAQTPEDGLALVYGVSAGPARRTVDGTFTAGALPSGASAPAGDRTVATFGLQVGTRLNRHVALLATWDQGFGGNTGTPRWGTSDVHAVGRVWLGRAWAQAGGGLANLGYKPTTGPGIDVTRYWGPGLQAAVGVDVAKTRRVQLTVAGRVTRATFDGLTITRFGFEVGLFSRVR